MEEQGYYTTTYRIRLFCERPEWVKETIVYYNNILSFYYNYLLKNQTLLILSNQKLLRELEIHTIGEKKLGKEAIEPLPYDKVPLYVRRSAVNTAISMIRSYKTQYEQWKDKKRKTEPKPAEQFHVSPIFYKGMYRNFQVESIELKLWNGEKWVWLICKFRAAVWKEGEKILSPTLKVNHNKIMLHVPVVSLVLDVRTLKERIKESEKICAVSFPNKDNLAVLAVLDNTGKCLHSKFIKGEKELSHKRNYWLNTLKKNKECMKDESKSMEHYPRYREKVKNLTQHYAHLVSRKIVDYCVTQQIKIIVVPNYKETINFNKIGYLNTTNYDWIGRRIIQYTRYKAFKEGIIVTSVNSANVANCCHICGGTIYKYNEGHAPNKNYYGGKKYICEQKHQGNTAFNTAINIGYTFLKHKVNPVTKEIG